MLKLRKKYFIVFVVFALACFLILKGNKFISDKISYALSFPQKIVTEGINSLSRPFGWFFDAKISSEEIESLRERLLVANSELARMREYEKENNFLREGINNKSLEGFDMVAGRIIGVEPSFFGDRIIVNVGTKDGISAGMPVVINGRILVGLVDKAMERSSLISTIYSNEFHVAVITQETQSYGIVYPDSSRLYMEIINKENTPKSGEQILTSAKDGLFPAGFLVGMTVNEITNEQEAEKTVLISGFFYPYELSNAYIITNFHNDFISTSEE